MKRDTLRKAINDDRLVEVSETLPVPTPTTASERSRGDSAAAHGMGTACTRTEQRIYAALRLSEGAEMRFEACFDVLHGGVLCALPALVNNGLLQTLRRDIIPRLLREVPGQPTEEQLDDDKLLCRFVIVFDREGYSPKFFKEM